MPPTLPSRRRLLQGLSLLVLVLFARSAPAQSYYLIVFAYQPTPNRARLAHSFATFIKAEEGDPCRLCAHTISWLPEKLDVTIFTRSPEPGKNQDLRTSLCLGQSSGARISAWGPYRIEKELYERALRDFYELESGKRMYKGVDFLYNDAVAANCVHTLSRLACAWPRLRLGPFSYGETASFRILFRMRRFIIEPEQTYPWVGTALGLDEFPIIWRHYNDYRFFFPSR